MIGILSEENLTLMKACILDGMNFNKLTNQSTLRMNWTKLHFTKKLRNILKIVTTTLTGGKMDEESMMAFMKEMKNTTELTDEEIAALAAAKIQDNKPKSRM